MTRLKFILLTVMAIACSFTMNAQVADLQMYATSKVGNGTFEAQFIGCDGNRAIYVEDASTRKKSRTELVAYNMDRQELKRVTLIEGDDTRCYGGFINGTHIDLLMADWKGDDMTLYRRRLGLESLVQEGERLVLADYKGTSGDKMGFRLASSSNQELLALLFYVGRESQLSEVQVALYSRELEEYWKMDTRARSTGLFYLTDEGEVVLGGMTPEGCKITIIDGENEVEYLIPEDDMPKNSAEMLLARYAGGKIFIAGTLKGEDYNKNLGGTQVNRIFSLRYDTKKKTTSTDIYTLTEQDRARLTEKDDDYKWMKTVRFFSLNQTMADADGYYAMMDQMWTVYLDGMLSSKNRSGQLVMRVADDGRIEWVKVFRMSQKAQVGTFPMMGYSWIRTERGPMLVWAEARRSADYTEDKPVSNNMAFKSTPVLTAAIIDRDGNITRQHWQIPNKWGLQGRPTLMENGNWLLLLRGKKKGQLAVMKVGK